ncbi:hypothetical protein D9613_011004 [Agrocybe pediades]|uniref:F-box domain-containing protein n=1 Tax=Agrocybe pediades TaxID=84607 RepID=A0A8H4QM02_9AGAR|nr:hypothetical protein D9613_011004 [Agrocybe pediades]
MNHQAANLEALAAGIESTTADMRATAMTIASAEQALKELTRKKYRLIDAHNSIADVMRRFPLEIVTTIFAFAIKYEPGDMPSQMVIGHVCKMWRNIVWSTPTLWEIFRIRLVKERFKQQEQLIQQWIRRAAACTLDIQIVLDNGLANTRRRRAWEPPLKFYRQLLDSCHRWTSFELHSPSIRFQGLLKTGAYHFPRLKHIMLFADPSQPPSPFDDLHTYCLWDLNQPPQLESVIVRSPSSLGMNIDWSLIKDFSVIGLFQCGVHILSMCSASTLTSLELFLYRVFPDDVDEISFHLVASNVHTLTVCGWPDSISMVLDMLTLPALADFTVEEASEPEPFPPDGYPDWTPSLLEMAHRSKFKPLSFALQRQFTSAIDDSSLEDILRAMPSLEKLYLVNPPTIPLSNACLRLLAIASYGCRSLLGPYKEISQIETDKHEAIKEPVHMRCLNKFTFHGPIHFSFSVLEAVVKSRLDAMRRSDHASRNDSFSVQLIVTNEDEDGWLSGIDDNCIGALSSPPCRLKMLNNLDKINVRIVSSSTE